MIWQLETILAKKTESTKLSTYSKAIPVESITRPKFTLNYPDGNTSFAEKNSTLQVPEISYGTADDIKQGTEVAFIDANDAISECGIEKYIIGHTTQTGTPIFICDNHNIVLEAWQLVKEERPTLIHIDQHRDDAAALQYESLHHTRICDYIDFAIKQNWIKSDIISIIESGDLSKLPLIPAENKICNIDLDIFAPECSVLSDEEKVDVILKAADSSSLITIATSPGFIDQQLAIKIAKLLWQYL
ncbi:MAG: hypothetical protein KAI74_06415 [Kiritimatiellae bacterium]|nr:hypothetical protein [Kiritimatiellia bacterium]